MGLKAASSQKLFELGQFLTKNGKTCHLRPATVAFLLECSPKELLQILALPGLDLHFQVLSQPGFVSFGPLFQSSRELQCPECPPNLLEKIQALLLSLDRDPKERLYDWLLLADCWEHIENFIRLEELSRDTLLRVIVALDFLGLHLVALKLWNHANLLHPGIPRKIWADIRGVPGSHTVELHEELRNFTEIEKNNAAVLKAIQSAPQSQEKLGWGFYARLIFLPFLALSMLLFFRFRRKPRCIDEISRNMHALIDDRMHWAYSNQVLANYWVNLESTIFASSKMVRSALFTGNHFLLLRSLDWWLYTSSHKRGLRVSAFLYRTLSIFARNSAPFLLADVYLHQGIIHYYEGDCLASLYTLSLAEPFLANENHPFNQNITLSNALRAAVSTRTPRFTHAIYFRILENPELKLGLYPLRTKLAVQIHRAREDGLISHLEHLRESYQNITGIPAFIRGSFEALMALAYLEAKEKGIAKDFHDRAKLSFSKARSTNAFKNVLKAIDYRIKAEKKSSPLWKFISPWNRNNIHNDNIDVESVIPKKIRAIISMNFREPTFCSDEQLALIDITNSFFSAWSVDDLFIRFNGNIRKWLPEFRYVISSGSRFVLSEAELPHDILSLLRNQIEKGEDSNQIFQLFSKNQVEWTYFTNQDEERSTQIALAAPSLYRKGGGNRFFFANSICAAFVNALNQLRAREKQLEFEKEKSKAEGNARLGKLASQVSHDIRSPLSALNMVVSTMQTLPEEKRIIIRSATQRINDIANQLLQTGRESSASPAPCANEPLLLVSILDSILSEKRMQFRDQCEVQILGDLDQGYGLFVAGDPLELTRALSNLLNNSVEAMEKKGSVSLRLFPDGEYAKIVIEDNGKGIPPEILSRLGKNQLSYGKEGTQSGSGLGIPHAVQMVEKMGGRFEIESNPGAGTTVSLSFLRTRGPWWFVDRIEFTPGQILVSLDDDQSIHQIWANRLNAAGLGQKVPHIHFSNRDQLANWLEAHPHQSARFLVDYELAGQSENGLSVMERLGIGARSVLVSSHYEEDPVKKHAKSLGVKILPKAMAPFVPLAYRASRKRAAPALAVPERI